MRLLTSCTSQTSRAVPEKLISASDNMGDTTTSTYTPFTPDDYSDYDIGSTENAGMCNRSWVREFRGRYEPPLFVIIFILGAVGNLLVVWICTTMKNRRTMTDVYLLNLAVADLLFLSTLPFWAVDAIMGWDFGVAMCKIVSAVYKINFFSSMLILTCISVDRYIAIVEATKAQNYKEKRFYYGKRACVGVWFVSFLLALPEFIFAEVKKDQNDQSFCVLVYSNNEDNQTKILVLSLQICMGFCLPLLVMFFCYPFIIHKLLQTRSFQRHKPLRVIFAVMFVFILSQLPHNSLLILEASQAANTTITACDTVNRFDIAGQIAKSLAYTHACLNPILYVFIGVRFRQNLRRNMEMCAGRGEERQNSIQLAYKGPSVMSEPDTSAAVF